MGRSKMMTQASDTQVGGTHYKDMGEFQPWDVLQHWLTPEEYRGYQKGVAITYLARERQKGGDTDISKAAHHLQKLVEVLGNKNVSVKVGIDNAPQCLTITDEWIDQVIASMPGGMNGFLKTWGLQQFARAVVEAHRDPAPTPAPDAPEVCCGKHATCTKPCVPRVQLHADADGWIQHDGSNVCPVPPDVVVRVVTSFYPNSTASKLPAHAIKWELVKKYQIVESK